MKNLNYLNPKATQTLCQAVSELRVSEGAAGDAAGQVAPDLVADINGHDVIHVLFACPTNLKGEILAHVWTAFGTTTKVRDMHRVNMHDDHRAVLADIGHRKLLRTWIRSLPEILITLFRVLRMKRQWPAEDYRSYLDCRLCDLRDEFGIRLPSLPPSGDSQAGSLLRQVRSSATQAIGRIA